MFSRLLSKVPLISNRTKILISSALLFFALLLCIINPDSFSSKLCLLAMLLSFLGDISLNIMPLNKRPHSLLYVGAFFFMVSHLIYASAYNYMIQLSGKEYSNPGAYIAYGIMVLVLLISIICIYIKSKSLKTSMIFVFILYILIISINLITIYSYSWSFKALSFIGATSFLVSDYIIGIENIFKIKNDTLRKLVWIFYPVGQILILACR